MDYNSPDFMKAHIQASQHFTNGEDHFYIVPLMFHVGVYINPVFPSGYEDRFCFHNEEIAALAINYYMKTEEMKWWKKWHTKSISAYSGYACKQDVPDTKEFACMEIDWDVKELEKKYPYKSPMGF